MLAFLKSFNDFISGTYNLHSLNLSSCEINEDMGTELFKAFSGAKSLSRLNLSGNMLKRGSILTLASVIKKNKHLAKTLDTLNLSRCYIADPECVELIKAVHKFKSLRQILLTANDVKEGTGEAL